MPRRLRVCASPLAPCGPARYVESRGAARSRVGAVTTPAIAARTTAPMAPRTTTRSPRRSMQPEAGGERVEAVPLLGIARRPSKHVAIQARHQVAQSRAPCGVEPGFQRVLGRRFGRMELHDTGLVQVEHGSDAANPERFGETGRTAQT